MERVHILGWSILLDRDATRAAYSRIAVGGARQCVCLSCLNYLAAASSVPAPVVELLRSLEIDPTKDLEVIEHGPQGEETFLYQGLYHLVGHAHSTSRRSPREVVPGFSLTIASGAIYRIPEWQDLPLVAVEWTGALPWLLDERPA